MMITIAYWYQIQWPIIIFHWEGHAVTLNFVDYKIFLKNMIFVLINAFLKLENIITLIPTFTH